MGRTACTEPQCLYEGALYLTSVPVQGCTLPYLSACTRVTFTFLLYLYQKTAWPYENIVMDSVRGLSSRSMKLATHLHFDRTFMSTFHKNRISTLLAVRPTHDLSRFPSVLHPRSTMPTTVLFSAEANNISPHHIQNGLSPRRGWYQSAQQTAHTPFHDMLSHLHTIYDDVILLNVLGEVYL